MPTKQHRWDAGWDLKSQNETFDLAPGDKVKVDTGVAFEIPARFMGLIVPRSGLGSKYRVGLANTVGVIDSEYRGNIFVNLVNDGSEIITIEKLERFCQLVILPINVNNLRVVTKLSTTGRGDGGFGSTGKTDKLIEDTLPEFEDEETMELEEILEWTETS